MGEYNRMQIIKRRFFAMRNGIIADTLRKAGLDYRMVFGLNLPQITEIAADQPKEAALAEELWADRRTRESLLLAPMLYPSDAMDAATALRWMNEVTTTEVADVLCLRLLRYINGGSDLATSAMTSDSPMVRYTALRLMLNLLNLSATPAGQEAGLPDTVTLARAYRPFAEAEQAAEEPVTRTVARQLAEEIAFLLEDDE
ncbi:MAG: DNA alkylation repair protein [Duncaniella sp.]|nr:DNA alkylation repair protein [Duncaniella sp.]